MSLWGSLRDVMFVARFEVMRSLRTWRAMALILVVLLGTAGAAFLFTALLGVIENSMAEALGAPGTSKPGAMLDVFLHQDGPLRDVIAGMVGEESVVDSVLAIPVISIFYLWISMHVGPFFAASTAAEAVSIDLGTKALRYEASRTGRVEIVLGRFFGQLLLLWLALVVAGGATWVIGQLRMVGNPPLSSGLYILWLSPRALVAGAPFVAFGLFCSVMTGSSAWARVLALSGTAVSYVLWAISPWLSTTWVGLVSDSLLVLLPQVWTTDLWGPGWRVLVAALVQAGLAGSALAGAAWLMLRQDL